MYYHVRVTKISNRTNDVVGLDYSSKSLKEKIIEPYHNGKKFVISGVVVDPFDIEEIRINETVESSTQLLPRIQQERRIRTAVAIGISDKWYITTKGRIVTDEFIKHPPRKNRPKKKAAIKIKTENQLNKPIDLTNWAHIATLISALLLLLAFLGFDTLKSIIQTLYNAG